MTQPNTTRRDVLRFGTSAAACAAGAAIVAGGVALASPAEGATVAADRQAWDAAYKRCADAKTAYDEDRAVFQPIFDAWSASKPDGRDVDIRAFHMIPRRRVLMLIDPDEYEAEWLASIGRNYFPNEREKAADLASIESLRAFRREQRAHDDRFNMDELGERSDALCDAWTDAQGELMATPAPDVAALQWKLENILSPNGRDHIDSYSNWYVAPILADVARLAAREA